MTTAAGLAWVATAHLPKSLVFAHGVGAAAAVVLSVLLILEGI